MSTYQASPEFFQDEEVTAVDFWATIETRPEFNAWLQVAAGGLDAGVRALKSLDAVEVR